MPRSSAHPLIIPLNASQRTLSAQQRKGRVECIIKEKSRAWAALQNTTKLCNNVSLIAIGEMSFGIMVYSSEEPSVILLELSNRENPPHPSMNHTWKSSFVVWAKGAEAERLIDRGIYSSSRAKVYYVIQEVSRDCFILRF